MEQTIKWGLVLNLLWGYEGKLSHCPMLVCNCHRRPDFLESRIHWETVRGSEKKKTFPCAFFSCFGYVYSVLDIRIMTQMRKQQSTQIMWENLEQLFRDSRTNASYCRLQLVVLSALNNSGALHEPVAENRMCQQTNVGYHIKRFNNHINAYWHTKLRKYIKYPTSKTCSIILENRRTWSSLLLKL